MIRILTGPIRSHKTTLLQKWVLNRTGCGGVLSPDNNGLRQLYNIKTRNAIAWQKTETDALSDVTIGRFVFDGAAFEEAIDWLNSHLEDPKIKDLILDEVGPLELKGKGWDQWLKHALQNNKEKSFILVVREGLVDKVVSHYGIDEYEVVTKEDFQDKI